MDYLNNVTKDRSYKIDRSFLVYMCIEIYSKMVYYIFIMTYITHFVN